MLVIKRIAILVNPESGRGNALKISAQVQKRLEEKSIRYSVFVRDWQADYSLFTEIWIIGGDGTLNYFLNLFPEIKIPMTIFKGGTGNDFSWKLYGDISVDEQIDLVLNATEKYVDAGWCNNKIFINVVGLGFDGSVLQSMQKRRIFGGHLDYLIVVLKHILTFSEFRYTIKNDGLTIADIQEYLLVMINNSSRTGGGFMVSPLADINDRLLNLILCSKLSVFKRLRYLPVIEKGNHLKLPFIKHLKGSSFSIKCNETIPAQLDGELIWDNVFEIKVLPRQFIFKY